MSPAHKAGAAKPWCPPRDERSTKKQEGMKDGQIWPETLTRLPSNKNSEITCLKHEIEVLRAENKDLKAGLQKAERLRDGRGG